MNLARRIDNYLRRKKSPLAGQGYKFVAAGRKYRFDPFLLVAISGAESSFATTKLSGRYNPFGWGPGIDFNSWGQAIDTVARGLRRGYLNEGRKSIAKIGAKWAPIGAGNDPTGLNNNWVNNVTEFYDELGGAGIGGGGVVTSPSSGAGASGLNPGLSAAPDLSGFADMAFENLGEISSGRGLDPVKAISSLAFTAASIPPPQTQQAVSGANRVDIEPSTRMAGTKVSAGITELFYDPLGGIKNGKQIGAIGGHGDHVHIALGNKKAQLAAINKARAMGLHVSEDGIFDSVDPVHVRNSYHYRKFPKSKLRMAADISGPAKKMAAYYRWVLGRFG